MSMWIRSNDTIALLDSQTMDGCDSEVIFGTFFSDQNFLPI